LSRTRNIEFSISPSIPSPVQDEMSSTKPVTKICVLPKSHDDQETWEKLVSKLKAFRLESLRESPEAFGSTLANEQAFTKDVWEERMKNPRATSIIAVAVPEGTPLGGDVANIADLVDGEWLSSTVLMRFEGDQIAELSSSDVSPWNHIPKGKESGIDGEGEGKRIVYVLNGLYVIPRARGLGIGSTLLKEALKIGYAMGRREGAAAINFRARVISANVGAVKLYEKAGFTMSVKETFVLKKHAALGLTQETVVWDMDL
jgi:GNAT superfamily N-acetyltransferase